jgi:hypothetical protein
MHVTSFPSIWLGAIANILAIAPDACGLLYLALDGTLCVVKRADDAPDFARYVSQIAPDSNPLRLAAQLAHVATH